MPDLAGDDYNIVTIRNPLGRDFTFYCDRSKGTPPYTIKAGEIKRFPKFLVRHGAKHLIDAIINEKHPTQRTSNMELRQRIMGQIIIDEEKFLEADKKTEAQKQQELIDKLNMPSELDRVLGKHQAKKKPAGEPKEKFDEIDEKDVIDTTDKNIPPVTTKSAKDAVPTRSEIIAYAKNTLGLVIDDKTLKKLERMKVTDLLKEIGDPRDALR